MTYRLALQKIEQAAAEQWEELDLSGMERTINYGNKFHWIQRRFALS